MKNEQCEKVPQYKCNKHGGLHCLGCKTYNIYCAGIRKGREIVIENNKKKLEALEIIKETPIFAWYITIYKDAYEMVADAKGFRTNDSVEELQEKFDLLKEVLL